MLRVKNGPCAPLRLSSMLSCPATGITSISVIARGRTADAGVVQRFLHVEQKPIFFTAAAASATGTSCDFLPRRSTSSTMPSPASCRP